MRPPKKAVRERHMPKARRDSKRTPLAALRRALKAKISREASRRHKPERGVFARTRPASRRHLCRLNEFARQPRPCRGPNARDSGRSRRSAARPCSSGLEARGSRLAACGASQGYPWLRICAATISAAVACADAGETNTGVKGRRTASRSIRIAAFIVWRNRWRALGVIAVIIAERRDERAPAMRRGSCADWPRSAARCRPPLQRCPAHSGARCRSA
jgi:hypothetical protein